MYHVTLATRACGRNDKSASGCSLLNTEYERTRDAKTGPSIKTSMIAVWYAWRHIFF